jgi:hypothetical protein
MSSKLQKNRALIGILLLENSLVDLPQKTGQRAKPINLNFQIYGKMKTV